MEATSLFNASNRTILAIGDAARQLSFAIGFLRNSGFTVTTSPGWATALRHVRATRPDLILLDASVDSLNSVDVCRRLKNDPLIGPVPVLTITQRLSDDAISVLAAGGDDYVTTPLQPDELVTRVETCMRMYALRKHAEVRLHATEQALRALANQRETDLEEERRRIAREMHDELGQQLVVLRMNVTLLCMEVGNEDPRICNAIDHVLTLVDTLVQSTRDVAASLRPAMLDMGLVPALEWLTARFTRHTGTAFLSFHSCHHDTAAMSESGSFAVSPADGMHKSMNNRVAAFDCATALDDAS